jgi:cytochrome c oxidase subunit IV
MSSHATEHTNQFYYEGDQSKLYSGIMQHHASVDSEESKEKVKGIWKVFWILLIITAAEVFLGMSYSKSLPHALVAFIFLSLTLVKAGYIVSRFMHLGDEFKGFIVTVLVPLVLFVWFIIAFLADGSAWLNFNTKSPVRGGKVIEATKAE